MGDQYVGGRSADDESMVVELRGVTRRFGDVTALDDVSLSVPRGAVLGLIGGNGAGKTTLIRHVLGLLTAQAGTAQAQTAQAGTVRVFGLDPAREPAAVLGRIGHLSEDRDLPDWMRVGELLAYSRAFYPRWDDRYAAELLAMFALDPRTRVGELSRGQRARAGLLVALAHRPDLLVLDEPSSGLDPVVRRDILGAIIRTVADEGRTVLFSSHLLDEVERVADRIAILDRGRLLLSAALDDVQANHRRLVVRFHHPQERAPALVGALSSAGSGPEWSYVCAGEGEQLRRAAEALGAEVVDESTLTLDEIFLNHVGARDQHFVDRVR